MDSVKTQMLQAMKTHKIYQFLNTLFLHSVLALICALFCSYPFWFPNLCSSVTHFAFVSLPNLKSFFFNPKFLFIMGNGIIIFLVGESKLSNSSSSPITEIYNEYVQKSRKIRELSSQVENKGEGKLVMNLLTEESVNKIEGVRNGGYDNGDKEAEEREEEEESGLATEELTKRVEDFIARVNRQRWVEARFEDFTRG